MGIKDLNIVDNNLLEDEVVETLKSVIDNISKDEKSEIKRKSLIRIFQQKIKSRTITNDAIKDRNIELVKLGIAIVTLGTSIEVDATAERAFEAI